MTGRPEDPALTSLDAVLVYGDLDDPARVVVALADLVARQTTESDQAYQQAMRCLDPRAPWKERVENLRVALLSFGGSSERHFVALWDVDALVPSGRDQWDGYRWASMQRDVFDHIRDSIEQGGWILVQTNRQHARTEDLDDLDGVEREAATPSLDEPTALETLDPEYVPIVRWLFERGATTPKDLERIVETVDDPYKHLVYLAYDQLPPSLRDSAVLLSVMRAPQRVNGTIGVLDLQEIPRPTATALPVQARRIMQECGFLQPGPAGTWRVPRAVRNALEPIATSSLRKRTMALHERLAAEAATSVFECNEQHFHAVAAGLVDLAKKTAHYYGTALREVAKTLSVDRKDWEGAADLYRHIVTTFDPTDAYAWEYLGYNLVRLSASRAVDPDEILVALTKGHLYWKSNPLYHGRLLGYRGRLGQDIADEAVAAISLYARSPDKLSYFAEPLIEGLLRGRRDTQVRRILGKTRNVLERLAPEAAAMTATP